MEKNQILETLKLVKEYSKKRNFNQSIDLIINLKGLNLKKPEENINQFIALPYNKGKENSIGALVGGELVGKANESCDVVIKKEEFHSYGVDPKKIKKMAKKVDFFIAQANLMPDVAKAFGRVLGPLGKMPNPKAGAVVPPVIPSLKPVVEKLKHTVQIQTKNELVVKSVIGSEDMDDDGLAENVLAVYNSLFHTLHEDKSKIVDVILKLSMGRPFVVGKKYSADELKQLSLKQPFKKALGEKEEKKDEKIERIKKVIKLEEKKKDNNHLKKSVESKSSRSSNQRFETVGGKEGHKK